MKRLTKQQLDDMRVKIKQVVVALNALENAFMWHKSLQGEDYWTIVDINLSEIEAAFKGESE